MERHNSRRDFRTAAYDGTNLETPEDYVERYKQLKRRRRFNEARIILSDAAENFPDDYRVQLQYGVDRMSAFNKEQGRNFDDAAEQALLKAITLSPQGKTFAYIKLAGLYERQMKDDAAKQYYDAALEIDPENVIALSGLGSLSLKHGDFDEAELYYLDALDLSPDDKFTLTRLGHAYQSVENFDLARGCFGNAFYLSVEARDVDLTAQRRLAEIEELSGVRYDPKDWDAVSERLRQTRDEAMADEPEAGDQPPSPNDTMGGGD